MITPSTILVDQDAARAWTLPRRDALKALGLLGVAAAAGGCTPLKIALHAYPRLADVDAVLRAFVGTIVPGAPTTGPHVVRVFGDPAYPFAPYRGYFAADLAARARQRFSGRSFDALDARERVDVVRRGLHADGTTRLLYEGAVLLAQIAVYAGIYDDDAGCALIDFPGRNTGYSSPDPMPFAAASLTLDGNVH